MALLTTCGKAEMSLNGFFAVSCLIDVGFTQKMTFLHGFDRNTKQKLTLKSKNPDFSLSFQLKIEDITPNQAKYLKQVFENHPNPPFSSPYIEDNSMN